MRSFSNKLLIWFASHGRKDLPWQRQVTPYRVWVSEIMLQQTQVKTVIPYFDRFMLRFPDIHALSSAAQDEVLHHWSGLGYYARARNLHKTAQIICDQNAGELPANIDDLIALPGIGRSTAGAILSLSLQQKHPILDGNVKRVLTRYHAIEGWPGQAKIEKKLWELASSHTPENQVADYTQAIMDLGATICTRSQPDCQQCPFNTDCHARKYHRQKDFPFSKPRKKTPIKKITLCLLKNDQTHCVLLEKRPPVGIWGGLWSLPEYSRPNNTENWVKQHYALQVEKVIELAEFKHTFSHFQLQIKPVLIKVTENPHQSNTIMDGKKTLWYNIKQPQTIGLAAPVTRLLEKISGDQNG